MRLTRSFVVLVLLLLVLLPAGCGDDGAATDGGGPDLDDMGADGQLDGTVPFNLPKGDAGHSDVGAKLTAGQVRAGRVTSSSQLLSGIKVEGKVGDYKIYNDRVAFIIRDERWSDGYGPFGGELLDAARLGQPGSVGESLLGEIFLGTGVRLLKPTSVGVVADGSDGKAAIVRAIGATELLPLLAGMMGSSIGGNPPVHVVIDYVLAPDSDVLEIRQRFFNKTTHDTEVTIVAVGFTSGDGTHFFSEEAGFDSSKAKAKNYLAMVSPDLSYVFYSPQQALFPLITYKGLLVLTGDSVDVPAAGEGSVTFHLGLTDGEPEAVRRMIRQLRKEPEPTPVTGTVTDAHSGAAVEGARVHVQRDDAAGSYETMARTDASGSYSLALEPGSYKLRVAADGYEVAAPVALQIPDASPVTQDLSLAGTAQVSYTVTDGSGGALPAKLIFKAAQALTAPPASFGEQTFPGGAALVIFSPDGKGTAKLPPGTYTVTASRGFEYEIDQATVDLAAGDNQSASFQLVRSVDTTGYQCGDFHLHAMWSPDSDDLYELKVSAFAAEGLELPVITDHEYIADLSPYITKLNLAKWVQGGMGEEVTTYAYGHFNPFPLEQDPSKPNMGALNPYSKTPSDLFAEVHQTWPAAVLQVNHPRSDSISGYFTYVDYDPTSGTVAKPSAWSKAFEAVELFNGSGWSSNKDGTIKDWFSFLDRGLLVAATGNSDSHDALRSEVGYPRNYIKLSTDEPAQASIAALAGAIKNQQVLVSGGPFINVEVGGKGMGEVAAATAKQATLSVVVQAPTWMPADTLHVIVGGVETHTITLDSTTADPTNPVIRYNSSLELLPTSDSWVVVVVTGSGNLDPVVRNAAPFAMTNPIYLDVDGNGVYDPPKAF